MSEDHDRLTVSTLQMRYGPWRMQEAVYMNPPEVPVPGSFIALPSAFFFRPRYYPSYLLLSHSYRSGFEYWFLYGDESAQVGFGLPFISFRRPHRFYYKARLRSINPRLAHNAKLGRNDK